MGKKQASIPPVFLKVPVSQKLLKFFYKEFRQKLETNSRKVPVVLPVGFKLETKNPNVTTE
jgi:hypothetical protein